MIVGIDNVAITVLSQKHHRIINAVFEAYFPKVPKVPKVGSDKKMELSGVRTQFFLIW